MNSYQKIGWLDHVEDVETGEVIQEGTPVSQTNMNHMDDGIFENREAVILHEAQIADAQKEIKVLKDATLNNMTNNVFLINFDSPAACRQKNAAEYLAGRSPGVMAQYGQGLFGPQQHTKSPHPAPEEDESGVLQLVEWREEAPYG